MKFKEKNSGLRAAFLLEGTNAKQWDEPQAPKETRGVGGDAFHGAGGGARDYG